MRKSIGSLAQRTGDDVDLRLRCPRRLSTTKPSVGPSRCRIGKNAVTVDIEVPPFIGSRQAVPSFFRNKRTGIRIGAGIKQDASGARDERTIRHNPGLHI